MIVVEPFSRRAPRRASRKLFEAASSSCFCRYWHFTGTKNDWLDRCAHRPEENLAEQAEAVARGDASARGLVAVDRDARRRRRRLDEARAARVGARSSRACPSIAQLARRARDVDASAASSSTPASVASGVARALARRGRGACACMGWPRAPRAIRGGRPSPSTTKRPGKGPERLFVELGFTPIHDVPPYPVYRKVVVPGMT